MTAVVGLAVGFVRVRQEKADKDAALAEANLLLARQAVDEMYTEVADQLAVLPHMQPYQRDVMQKALRFYQEFARRRSTDPDLRVATAHAGLRVLQIRWTLGQRDGCEAGAREALAALEWLAEERTADPKGRVVLADAGNFLGNILSASGRFQEAKGHHRRAIALLGELAAEHPDEPDYVRRLATTLGLLGQCLRDRPWESEACHREAVRLSEHMVARWPADSPRHWDLAKSYYMLGNALVGAGRAGMPRTPSDGPSTGAGGPASRSPGPFIG